MDDAKFDCCEQCKSPDQCEGLQRCQIERGKELRGAAVNDEKFKQLKAEQAPELDAYIKDMREWIAENLKDKSPERADRVESYLRILDTVVAKNPEESQAALAGLNAMSHLLYGSAKAGYKIFHRPKPPYRKVTEQQVNQKLEELHQSHPTWGITRLRTKAADLLKINYDHLRKEYPYNPTRESETTPKK